MRTLKEDLNKMDSLTGEELDLFLTDMKAYYTSPAWLYQRINGNSIRGQVYSLSPEEIDILNFALRDISNKIGSLSIKC